MNILFVSHMSGNLWAGPNNSIPAQIKAQSRIDNVFWYNLNHNKRPEWSENGLNCMNLSDYPTGRLRDLPEPFNHPDIVVVEQCYAYLFCKLIKDIQKARIPYVIIPRSAFTKQAQGHKALKKRLGNMLYFNRMVKKAAAIHYLTEEEKVTSEQQWGNYGYVIPNGIFPQEVVRTIFPLDRIRASYIGRIEIYQKGLDLLLEAIIAVKSELRNVNFVLNLYGPNREGAVEVLERKVQENGIADIVTFHEGVFGKDKREVFLNTDVFVMTSRFEGHPMGLIEALSYGIPCLATQGTYMAEKISGYEAGWMAGNDVESVKRALRSMMAEKERFAVKGANALKLASVYSWDKIAQKTHAELEKIVESYK